MVPDVTLITPTGGRPQAFELCKRYVARQKFSGKLQWIVVDDGWPATIAPKSSDNCDVSVIRITPSALGEITLKRNLLAAMPEVRGGKVLMIEDDDWYAEDYVAQMSLALDTVKAAGCWKSYYYHVPLRQYRVLTHPGRSSLCHTGFRAELLPQLESVCETTRGSFVDVPFWETINAVDRYLSPNPMCVGIKGMPGRAGIGIGHRPENGQGWIADGGMSVLRSLIGEDLVYYA